tara:strand:+ start:218 stop:409 length:192 start_codon:yes stop_codon:yes gene_type:complete
MAVDREQILAIRPTEVRTTMAPSRSPASDGGSAVFGTRTKQILDEPVDDEFTQTFEVLKPEFA